MQNTVEVLCKSRGLRMNVEDIGQMMNDAKTRVKVGSTCCNLAKKQKTNLPMIREVESE